MKKLLALLFTGSLLLTACSSTAPQTMALPGETLTTTGTEPAFGGLSE